MSDDETRRQQDRLDDAYYHNEDPIGDPWDTSYGRDESHGPVPVVGSGTSGFESEYGPETKETTDDQADE